MLSTRFSSPTRLCFALLCIACCLAASRYDEQVGIDFASPAQTIGGSAVARAAWDIEMSLLTLAARQQRVCSIPGGRQCEAWHPLSEKN